MKINEITNIIQGEGIYVGTPEIMIRTQGCSMNCVNCDSPETKSFKKGKSMSVNKILEEVSKYKQKNVSISGGNPIEQNYHELLDLVRKLKQHNYLVNIEMTGCDKISSLEETLLNKVDFISFDIKTPSSGSLYQFNGSSALWAFKAQYKAVVSDWRDYNYVKDMINSYRNIRRDKFVITPAWNYNSDLDRDFVQKLTKQILKDGLGCRLIPQTHKMVYDSTKKGV